MDRKNTIVRVRDLSFTYPGRDSVIKNLNVNFHTGDRVGLVGPNGSGKTTLFHLIMGLLKPTGGSIEYQGKELKCEKDFRKLRQKVGLLFQDTDDQLFCPTVLEDVAFGPLNQGYSTKEAERIALQTLGQLGLEGFEKRITHKLSGGEKKLVSLATVLSMKPDILLLDEPTTGLDESTKTRLIKILTELDLSYVIISHEFDFLSDTTDSIFNMKDGQVTYDSKVHIHKHIHAHAYGDGPHGHS